MALSKDDEAYRKNHREQQKNEATPDVPPHRGLHTSSYHTTPSDVLASTPLLNESVDKHSPKQQLCP